MSLRVPEIGQNFSIGQVEESLNAIESILRVSKVKIVLKEGENKYSDTRIDIKSNMSLDSEALIIPSNMIWEVKFKEDIKINVY